MVGSNSQSNPGTVYGITDYILVSSRKYKYNIVGCCLGLLAQQKLTKSLMF